MDDLFPNYEDINLFVCFSALKDLAVNIVPMGSQCPHYDQRALIQRALVVVCMATDSPLGNGYTVR